MTDPQPSSRKPGTRPTRNLKYEVIRSWISERIASGEFACGEQLPSEHDIMDRFSVSRVTARQAFDALRRAGLVDARRGKGYFVARPRANASLERLQSFGEMMAPLGLATHSQVIELLEVPAADDVAQALGVEAGATVMRLARSRMAGTAVVSLDVGYYPQALGRRLMLLDLANEDVFLLMENVIGIELGYADVALEVQQAKAPHARDLATSGNAGAVFLGTAFL